MSSAKNGRKLGRPRKSVLTSAPRLANPNTDDANEQLIAMSIHDVVKRTGLSKSTIYAQIAARKLRVRKLGARTLVLPQDLAAWVARLPQR